MPRSKPPKTTEGKARGQTTYRIDTYKGCNGVRYRFAKTFNNLETLKTAYDTWVIIMECVIQGTCLASASPHDNQSHLFSRYSAENLKNIIEANFKSIARKPEKAKHALPLYCCIENRTNQDGSTKYHAHFKSHEKSDKIAKTFTNEEEARTWLHAQKITLAHKEGFSNAVIAAMHADYTDARVANVLSQNLSSKGARKESLHGVQKRVSNGFYAYCSLTLQGCRITFSGGTFATLEKAKKVADHLRIFLTKDFLHKDASPHHLNNTYTAEELQLLTQTRPKITGRDDIETAVMPALPAHIYLGQNTCQKSFYIISFSLQKASQNPHGYKSYSENGFPSLSDAIERHDNCIMYFFDKDASKKLLINKEAIARYDVAHAKSPYDQRKESSTPYKGIVSLKSGKFCLDSLPNFGMFKKIKSKTYTGPIKDVAKFRDKLVRKRYSTALQKQPESQHKFLNTLLKTINFPTQEEYDLAQAQGYRHLGHGEGRMVFTPEKQASSTDTEVTSESSPMDLRSDSDNLPSDVTSSTPTTKAPEKRRARTQSPLESESEAEFEQSDNSYTGKGKGRKRSKPPAAPCSAANGFFGNRHTDGAGAAITNANQTCQRTSRSKR